MPISDVRHIVHECISARCEHLLGLETLTSLLHASNDLARNLHRSDRMGKTRVFRAGINEVRSAELSDPLEPLELGGLHELPLELGHDYIGMDRVAHYPRIVEPHV